MNKDKKIWYIDGINPSTARKIANCFFGGFYFSLKVNEKEYTYDVFLKDGIAKDKIDNFKRCWGGNWKIYIYKGEQA